MGRLYSIRKDSLMVPYFCCDESGCRKEERKEVEVGKEATYLYL